MCVSSITVSTGRRGDRRTTNHSERFGLTCLGLVAHVFIKASRITVSMRTTRRVGLTVLPTELVTHNSGMSYSIRRLLH